MFPLIHGWTDVQRSPSANLRLGLVLGNITLALAGIVFLMAFLAGAMCTAVMVNWGLRQHLHSSYSLPLLLESVALLVFGVFGAAIAAWSQLFVPVTVVLLCFIMGLQNAVITKISKAEIRTTHITGLVTDLGIELGKLIYMNRAQHAQPVRANRQRLQVHASLIAGFMLGGLAGAWGFKHWGYITTAPLAAMLWVLCLRPLLADLRERATRIHPTP
jgi:uncharacterized membrane protein YoaK (UPF0700 family)